MEHGADKGEGHAAGNPGPFHAAPRRLSLQKKPNIVLPKYRTVIFVHGCFWHRHKGCKDATSPKSNVAFWEDKFERNISNDRKHARQLRSLGWYVLMVWSCELKNPDRILCKLERGLH